MDRALQVLAVAGLLLLTATGSLVAQSQPPVAQNAARLPAASRPTKISGDNPTLTPEARAARAQGTMTVRIQVEADGTVSSVTLVESLMWQYLGPSMQDVEGRKINVQTSKILTVRDVAMLGMDTQVAIVLKKWRYRPANDNGKPVATTLLLELPFTLDAKSPG